MIRFQTVFISTLVYISTVFSLDDPVFMIKKNGYPAEKHIVKTIDGHVTVLHRIPHGINSSIIGDPILVTHGMGSSSADFLCPGPDKSYGYVLADAGYDVWLSNCRGNSYSLEATVPSPEINNFHLKTYYNFSVHEIGIYDYAAQIDYILKKTHKEQLFYSGHSQGGTGFYILMAKMPKYNKKIRLASLLAPSAMLDHTNRVLTAISQYIYPLENLADTLSLYRVPYIREIRNLLLSLCSNPENELTCRTILNSIVGYDDYEQLNATRIFPLVFRNSPSEMSLKCAFHYGQIIKEGVFQEYNYGKEGNLRQYGTEKPPPYNLTAITAPIAIYYGKNDLFINEQDINTITSKLPNVVKKYSVKRKKWNHVDFLLANDVVPLLYDEVLKTMKTF